MSYNIDNSHTNNKRKIIYISYTCKDWVSTMMAPSGLAQHHKLSRDINLTHTGVRFFDS